MSEYKLEYISGGSKTIHNITILVSLNWFKIFIFKKIDLKNQMTS